MRLSTFNRRLRDGTAWTTGWTREEINEPMEKDERTPNDLDQDTGEEEVEHEEEPNEAMAIALYEEATAAGLTEDLGPWSGIGDNWRKKWRTLAAKGHEAYHRMYEQKVQTYPV